MARQNRELSPIFTLLICPDPHKTRCPPCFSSVVYSLLPIMRHEKYAHPIQALTVPLLGKLLLSRVYWHFSVAYNVKLFARDSICPPCQVFSSLYEDQGGHREWRAGRDRDHRSQGEHRELALCAQLREGELEA